MKIKGFIINDKKYIHQKIFIMLIIYVLGIIGGAVYCSLISSQHDASLSSYLLNFFTHLKDEPAYLETFKSSLIKNIRLFFIIYVMSFFRIGAFGIMSTVAIKGFVSGFASGVFIKYYGVKGLLLSMSPIFSNLLFIPAFLLLASASAIMASDRKNADKVQKRKYLILAICCLTIFCASSVLDSFLTTTFMKFFSSHFAK